MGAGLHPGAQFCGLGEPVEVFDAFLEVERWAMGAVQANGR
jgi:hypothetical protein